VILGDPADGADLLPAFLEEDLIADLDVERAHGHR
jgi:hypothetical protein